jgi:glycerol-3-phosphate dehydrogenase (NAD(P)+)
MANSTKIAVLGDGAMGTTCALLLAKRLDHEVWLWSARSENAAILREHRENLEFLPGVRIPETIRLTTNIEAATCDAALLVVAIPMVYLRDTLARHASVLRQRMQAIVSTVKGLELGTFRRPSEVIAELLRPRPVCALSGPGHAEEISRGLPACLVAASPDLGLARQLQERFGNERLRIYTNPDIIGVELGGAVKNIVGIAAGICDGLGFGDNAKSALLTRFLVELVQFGVAHGAEAQTFYGLAGIGDMITTSISPHGRNHRVGQLLGKGRRLPDILSHMHQVAEGVWTTRSVYDRARQIGVEMPIVNEVYRVLYEDKDPRVAVQELMLREPTSES